MAGSFSQVYALVDPSACPMLTPLMTASGCRSAATRPGQRHAQPVEQVHPPSHGHRSVPHPEGAAGRMVGGDDEQRPARLGPGPAGTAGGGFGDRLRPVRAGAGQRVVLGHRSSPVRTAVDDAGHGAASPASAAVSV